MNNLMQTIRREFRSHVVIFDLPPMLVGDDVIDADFEESPRN